MPHFLHSFWRKKFITFYSIKWANFIVWLPLPLEILGNMCIGLREKCPNMEFFLGRIFLYSDWTQENTDQKKLCIWALFTQCCNCLLSRFWRYNLEINPSFLIKPFFQKSKKVRKKLEYLKNEKKFLDETKSIFCHF